MSTATKSRKGSARVVRQEPRGWGQAVWVEGQGNVFPNGRGVVSFDYSASICDQLRSVIAHHRRSSYAIARAAGVSRSAIDHFMQGDDTAISLPQAATIARLVGHRLADQSTIEGLVQVWERSGEPHIRLPASNRLERRAWKAARAAGRPSVRIIR